MKIKQLCGLTLVMMALGFTQPAEAKKPQPAPAASVEKPASAPSVPDDAADVARIEAYLNAMTSLQADFSQSNDMGAYRHGKIALLRSGKMHVTYDAPSEDFIVADGHFINIWDGELKQQTSVPLDASLGDLVLRADIKLSGELKVTDIQRGPAKIELSVISTKDTGMGQLTLIFEDKPLQLRGWKVLDGQGRTTTVRLENARERVDLPSGLFTFMPPNLGKNHR